VNRLSIFALAWILSLSIGLAENINVTVNVVQPVAQPTGYFIMKSLVGVALGVGFFGAVISLLFGIDFFKTKNPLVSIVMAMIGLAVILLMFTYIWGML